MTVRRLSPRALAPRCIRLRGLLTAVGGAASAGRDDEVQKVERVEVEVRLDELRALYESYLEGLAERLLMALPPWVPAADALDDWQTTDNRVTAPRNRRAGTAQATTGTRSC